MQPLLCTWSLDWHVTSLSHTNQQSLSLTVSPQLCCRSGKGAGESMVPFVPVGKECCTERVGKEAEERVFCWMLDLDRTPVSIYLLYKLTMCSWLIFTFILLVNISSQNREEKFVKRFYLIHHVVCCFFHLSGNSGSASGSDVTHHGKTNKEVRMAIVWSTSVVLQN